MSTRWKVITSLSFVIAAVLVVLGYVVPQLLSFTENLFAEAIGLAVAFGLAILAIEGRLLTQQARRRRIVSRISNSIVAEASEIGFMLTRELATWLVSELDSTVELTGDDWDTDIKPLLRQVYNRAELLCADAVPVEDGLPYEEYRNWINSMKDYSRRIRSRIEINLEVNEHLLELSEALDCFDSILTRSMWPVYIRTDIDRFHSLGRVGNALIRLTETISAVYTRLQ